MNGRALAKTVLVFLALTLLPAAGAHAEAVSEGSVQLKLGASLAKKMRREGVRLVGLGPAKAGAADVTLPVTSGATDPKYGSGYLYLGGGFRLQAGKRKAIVKRLILDTSKRALSGVVNGIAVKLATLPPQRAALDGFELEVGLKSLQLTPKAASDFNRGLGLDGFFKAGRSLGSAVVLAHLEWLLVTSGEISLAIDSAFREKLQSVEADVSAPTLTMAVQNGRVTPELSGFFSGENGLAFVQHDVSEFGEPFDRAIGFITTFVSLESHTVSGGANVNFNPQRPPYNGPMATLPATPIQFNAKTGEGGASMPMALDAAMASLLNETIGASRGKPSLFSTGESLGTVSFTIRTR